MIGFLSWLETPWHDYLLLAVLVALVLLAAVGAVELIDMAVFAWRGRRSPQPEMAAPVAPAVTGPAQAALDDAYAHATAQAEAVAENGSNWGMPSREQVEREVAEAIDPASVIAERGITELEAWMNSGPRGSDGAP